MFVFCQCCGARLTPFELSSGRHECEPEAFVEFQVRTARLELEQGLEARVQVWARDPRLAKRVAFARYLRARERIPILHARRRVKHARPPFLSRPTFAAPVE
jgi:hypothetical protein